MPTKFSEVYERAIFKFKDFSFLTNTTEVKEVVLKNYLLSSITDFQHVCKIDITKYDLEVEQFDEVLDNEIIEILSLGIAFYWLSAQLLNSQLLKNRIHNSDYSLHSPANLLKEIRSLKQMIEQEYKGKINTYSFRNGGIETLKV